MTSLYGQFQIAVVVQSFIGQWERERVRERWGFRIAVAEIPICLFFLNAPKLPIVFLADSICSGLAAGNEIFAIWLWQGIDEDEHSGGAGGKGDGLQPNVVVALNIFCHSI